MQHFQISWKQTCPHVNKLLAVCHWADVPVLQNYDSRRIVYQASGDVWESLAHADFSPYFLWGELHEIELRPLTGRAGSRSFENAHWFVSIHIAHPFLSASSRAVNDGESFFGGMVPRYKCQYRVIRTVRFEKKYQYFVTAAAPPQLV